MENIPQPEKKYILADILKKRRHQQALQEQRVKQIHQKRSEKKNKVVDFLHPEMLIKKYRKEQVAYSNFKRKQQKLERDHDNSIPLNKNLLVIRIRGFHDISDKQQLVLAQLRLKKINSCVFLQSTPQNIRKLKLIDNYITFGLPSRKTIQDLILKRGHIQKEDEIVALTSNQTIEDAMEDQNIICIEDLVESISLIKENYDLVTKKLMQVVLSNQTTLQDNQRVVEQRNPTVKVENGVTEKIRSIFQLKK